MEESKEKEKDGPDLDRIGLFKEMSYHNGYLPPKISFNDASKKGKQMMTNSTKSRSGNQDGYFQEAFQRAFEGDDHVDVIRLNRLYRLEKAKRNLTPCFKYTSPTKKPSGKGSNYGTFSEYEENKPEYFSSKGADRGQYEPPKKNFYVNPPKKGTGYGYPDVTIGKLPPYFLETEYEELKNIPIEQKKPQTRTYEPYRAGIFQQEFFDPNPYRTDMEDAAPQESEEKKDKEDSKFPFYPSSPAKKDGGTKGGCLNIFPEHISDPYPKIDLVPRGIKRYINAENQMFRPVPGVRPYPVKSVINTNVDKRINKTNFASFKGDPLWKK